MRTDPTLSNLYPFSTSLCLAKELWLHKISFLGKNFLKMPLQNTFTADLIDQQHRPSHICRVNQVDTLLNLNLDQLFNHHILSLDQINNSFNIDLDHNQHFHLRTFIHKITKLFEDNFDQALVNINILKSNKRTKSNFFRKPLIELAETKNTWCINKLIVNETVNILAPLQSLSPLNCRGIPNYLKITYFKFINNTLVLDCQINKFSPDTSPFCKFCTKIPYLPPARETTNHWLTCCPAIHHIRNFLHNFLVSLGFPLPPDSVRLDLLPNNADVNKNCITAAFTVLLLYINFLLAYKHKPQLAEIFDFLSYLETETTVISKFHPNLTTFFNQCLNFT
jgi:hypothetical protein